MPHPKIGRFINCRVCGKQVYKKMSTIKKHNYCSHKCVFEFQRDSNHPHYKGGYKRPDGYVTVRENCRIILLHRKIMQDYIGRKLLASEIVHHINHNTLDNRIENLQIVSRSEHNKIHCSLPTMKKHLP